MRLARRTDAVLGERWELPRDREPSEELDDLEARFARGELALGADAARALRGDAAREGMTHLELAPGVRMMAVRTPTLPPATHTNVFVVGDRDAVLVEPATPYDDELDRIAEWIGSLEGEGVVPGAILLTHHHVDHVGGARALAQALDLPLLAHAETAARLPRGITIERLIGDSERIELGTTALRAVHTPGHAPGHLCFVEERSGVMIAGDMVAGTGTILVEPGDGDMQQYLDSLRRMAAERPSALAPAHGGVLRPPGLVLERYVEHRLAREGKVRAALEGFPGGATAGELVPIAYADAPPAVWPIARLSTEAHLIKLEGDGRVERTSDGWAAR